MSTFSQYFLVVAHIIVKNEISRRKIVLIGLLLILIAVLVLPFSSQLVERNLELFLFLMGLTAAFVSNQFQENLLREALRSPIYITLAVLLASLLFRFSQNTIAKHIDAFSRRLSLRFFLMMLIIGLGLVSSIITAIIAAIILVLIVDTLRMDRKSEVQFVILACFSIGMGAALTPIGEPLSTIATNKLNENFFYLLYLIGPTVIPGIVLFGLFAAFILRPKRSISSASLHLKKESYHDILSRSFKIYLFVMALTLLGASFEPFIEKYLLNLHPLTLYWINIISAVLDNATLAAAEVSPAMDASTIQAILLGLLISGGMLIPGNIPNIIVANKLNITSKEWARFGIPFGLLTMCIYFIVILLFV